MSFLNTRPSMSWENRENNKNYTKLQAALFNKTGVFQSYNGKANNIVADVVFFKKNIKIRNIFVISRLGNSLNV
jgi:hypothetical protein